MCCDSVLVHFVVGRYTFFCHVRGLEAVGVFGSPEHVSKLSFYRGTVKYKTVIV